MAARRRDREGPFCGMLADNIIERFWMNLLLSLRRRFIPRSFTPIQNSYNLRKTSNANNSHSSHNRGLGGAPFWNKYGGVFSLSGGNGVRGNPGSLLNLPRKRKLTTQRYLFKHSLRDTT
jgi:hypothetical protein